VEAVEYSISVKTDNKLVMFVYALLAEDVDFNRLERAVDWVRQNEGGTITLPKGPLAVMAQEVARVILGHGTIGIQAEAGLVCSKCGTIYLASDYHKFKEVQGKSECPKCGEPWKTDDTKQKQSSGEKQGETRN
jgi:DNA-directed RNA polymerase subunit RPC12/RpoP